MTRPVLAGLLLLALGACSEEPRPSLSTDTTSFQTGTPAPAGKIAAADSASAPSENARIILGANGVRLADASSSTGTELRFGMNQDSVVAALTARHGAPRESGTNGECGGGSTDYAAWSNGLTLWFTGREFQGWGVSESGTDRLRTERGIGVGSTRAALDSAGPATVNESTLGQEFQADSIYGVLSGAGRDARVTNLWGGTTCIFR